MDHDSNSSVFLLTTNDRFHASFSQFDEHCFYLLKSSASAQMVALDRRRNLLQSCHFRLSGHPDSGSSRIPRLVQRQTEDLGSSLDCLLTAFFGPVKILKEPLFVFTKSPIRS